MKLDKAIGRSYNKVSVSSSYHDQCDKVKISKRKQKERTKCTSIPWSAQFVYTKKDPSQTTHKKACTNKN